MNFESEINVIKAQVSFLVRAYTGGLIINGLSFLGILIAVVTLIFKF